MIESVSYNLIKWIGFGEISFALLHLACIAVVWTGWGPAAVWIAFGLYVIRMLVVTGVYHRYFSHRAYKTSRFWQFVFAVVASEFSL